MSTRDKISTIVQNQATGGTPHAGTLYGKSHTQDTELNTVPALGQIYQITNYQSPLDAKCQVIDLQIHRCIHWSM